MLLRVVGPLVAMCLLLGCGGINSDLPLVPEEPAPTGSDGAPGDPFLWYTPEELDEQLTRRGSAEVTGSVTLNGATTTSASYEDAPFDAMITGKSGDLALITLAPIATPSAPTNSVRVEYRGIVASYGSLPYTTNNSTNYMPLYLTATEPVGVRLFNSATAAGPLYSQAVKYAGSIQTIPKEDGGEPNDDGNVATYSDRTMASTLANGSTLNRSFFRKVAVTNEDREDWYKLSLFSGNRYRITLTNSNGTWGNWTYDLRLLTNAGTVILTRLGVTGTSSTFDLNVSTDATFYVQVAGTPTSRKGASVYYGAYSLNLKRVAIPGITTITPTGLAGTELHDVTFSATATGEPTGWLWNFGGGAEPNTSTAAAPVVRLLTPGVYTGTVTATNDLGSCLPVSFQYQVTDLTPTVFDYHTIVAGTNMSLEVVEDRILLAYTNYNLGHLKFATCDGVPVEAAGWVHHTVKSSGVSHQLALEVIGGVPVIAYRNATPGQLSIARGVVALPSVTNHWDTHVAVVSTVSGGELALVDSGGRIAVVHTDSSLGDLRFTRATSTAPTSSSNYVSHSIDADLPELDTHSTATLMGNQILVLYSEILDENTEICRIARSANSTPTSSGSWQISDVTTGPFYSRLSITSIGNVAYLACGTEDTNFYRHLGPDNNQFMGNDNQNGNMYGSESLAVVDGRLVYVFPGTNFLVTTPNTTNPTSSIDWDSLSVNPYDADGKEASVADYNGHIIIASTDQTNIYFSRARSPW